MVQESTARPFTNPAPKGPLLKPGHFFTILPLSRSTRALIGGGPPTAPPDEASTARFIVVSCETSVVPSRYLFGGSRISELVPAAKSATTSTGLEA